MDINKSLVPGMREDGLKNKIQQRKEEQTSQQKRKDEECFQVPVVNAPEVTVEG